jgi:large subunit ribosomal protein L9
MMKLILTKDVSGLGEPGDIVEVKPGYGRNFLVPNGLAVAWTKGGEKQIEVLKKAIKGREIRDAKHAAEVKAAVEALVVTVPAKVGKDGKLFGSVGAADITAAIEAAGGPKLDRHAISLEHAFKTAGKHEVAANLHDDVTATVSFEIVPA